jgi:nicotinamidase-related amidase
MNQLPGTAALVIIDVQDGFNNPWWGERNNAQAEEKIAKLLSAWRGSRRPIYHVQHLSRNPESPLHPNNPGSKIKDIVSPLPGEPVFQKSVNSAFIGTDLEKTLRQNGIETLVIVGLTTPHCVSTTTRMAGNLGFDTFLVGDATACFGMPGPDGKHYSADEVHAISLATLHREFATVVNTQEVLAAALNP